MASIHFIYASTSGHTEYTIGEIAVALRAVDTSLSVEVQRVEKALPEDILRGDVVVLASGTWNTGGVEGQLNPHMVEYLGKAKDTAFNGKHVAVIALGDARYRYTAKAGDHLRQFVTAHGGTLYPNSLKIVNEPYGQEEQMLAWAKEFHIFLRTLA